jgi:hypothetical protein
MPSPPTGCVQHLWEHAVPSREHATLHPEPSRRPTPAHREPPGARHASSDMPSHPGTMRFHDQNPPPTGCVQHLWEHTIPSRGYAHRPSSPSKSDPAHESPYAGAMSRPRTALKQFARIPTPPPLSLHTSNHEMERIQSPCPTVLASYPLTNWNPPAGSSHRDHTHYM